MDRRTFLSLLGALPAGMVGRGGTGVAGRGAGAFARRATDGSARPLPDVTEASIAELGRALDQGRTTSLELVDTYLARMAAYDRAGPELNSLLRVNPAARARARELDRERAQRGPRGGLHGIPVVVKANYGTADLPTSAGSVALAGHLPARDAFQIRRLREAGAIILAKANMYELALDWTTVSSLGGVTRNPYDPTRTPGGSSGGTAAAVAASLAAVGWGTDTCGSIRLPASHTGLFGLRPTRGLSSIGGIVPLSHTQDTAGPLARTATDLALALDATVGADPADPATAAWRDDERPSFTAGLDADALRGARLGILSNYADPSAMDPEVARVVADALQRLAEAGAELPEVEIPDLQERLAGFSLEPHEFKWDLRDYLEANPGAPVSSLTQILDRGLIHEDALALALRYDRAPAQDTDAYRKALAIRAPLRDATNRLLEEEGLDALVYPVVRRRPAPLGEPQRGSTCALSAATGLPALAVPAGISERGLPVGIELLGRALADARLVAFGFAFERAVGARRPPSATPPLESGAPQGPSGTPSSIAVPYVGSPGPGRTVLRGDVSVDGPGRLRYRVQVSGIPAGAVHAVVVRSTEGGGPYPVLHRLSGPGTTSLSGTLELDDAESRQRREGRLYLQAFTAREALGGEPLPLPSGGG